MKNLSNIWTLGILAHNLPRELKTFVICAQKWIIVSNCKKTNYWSTLFNENSRADEIFLRKKVQEFLIHLSNYAMVYGMYFETQSYY